LIRSFADSDTKELFGDRFVRRFQAIERIARRKLIQIDQAAELRDLSALPGNMLESLKGDRKGQYSIRINDRFRVCFIWSEGDAFQVEIVDYH
jgi:proteic killer suppression protein